MTKARQSSRFHWVSFLRLAAAAVVGIAIALSVASLVVSQSYVNGITQTECPDLGWEPAQFGLPDPGDVSFVTTDGVNLNGWYLPGTNGATIILLGGIGTRGGMLPEGEVLAHHGYGLLLFDWRGCGTSQDALHTLGYQEALDLVAATDYLIQNTNSMQVGVLGFSVGGAAAIRGAAQHPGIGAVVAMGNYYDLEADIFGKGDEHPLLAAVFETEIAWLFQRKTGVDFDRSLEPVDLVSQISPRPLFLIYGELEEEPPPANGQILFRAA